MSMQTITETERAALEVLRSTGVGVLEAALMAKEALERGRGRVRRARRCLALGEEQLRLQEKTVTFAKAAEEALAARERKGLRARSLCDFRYYCKRLLKRNPRLAQRRVRSITADECRTYLERAFSTPTQFKKGRLIMSGVFSTAFKKGWCRENPVVRVEVPPITETPIAPLTQQEVQRLEATATQPEHRDMQLSLHLMLYCGIRPTEVSRLDPERDIDRENGQVIVRPNTSKTGGGRVVPLRGGKRLRHVPLTIPKSWQRRWRELRQAAGFCGTHRWVPDVCRHSFASYHAAHFRNLQELQWEMGHRDTNLLRTRYVSPVSRQAARRFWQSA